MMRLEEDAFFVILRHGNSSRYTATLKGYSIPHSSPDFGNECHQLIEALSPALMKSHLFMTFASFGILVHDDGRVLRTLAVGFD